MNRNLKLIAYTLFALLFPFWIFLGKISEKPAATNNNNLNIDTSSLKLILKTISDINTNNNSSNTQNQDAWRATLEKIASLKPFQNNTTVQVKPVTMNTNPKDPEPGKPDSNNVANVPVNKINEDSLENILDDIAKKTASLQRNIDTNGFRIITTVGIDLRDRSLIRVIDLRNLCDSQYSRLKNSLKNELLNIKSFIRERTQGNSSTDKLLSLEITSLQKKAEGLINTLSNLPTQTDPDNKYYVAIKNNSQSVLTINPLVSKLEKTTPLEFVSTDSILTYTHSTNSIKLMPKQTAYFQVGNGIACAKNVFRDYFFMPVTFKPTGIFSGFRKAASGTLSVNFKFVQ